MANHGFPATFSQLGFISLLVGLTSCSGVSTVQDVQTHPHRNWLTSTVYLRGKVSDPCGICKAVRVPLIKAQVYQLQDSTGTIWVLTDKATPKVSDRIYIKGQVQYEKIPIDGQDFGEAYIKEQEQLDPDPKKK
jgi:hypothetical protein